jgi:hypothetical protein
VADFDFDEAVAKNLTDKQSKLQDLFVKFARMQKWPEEVINSIRVVIKDKKVTLEYPPGMGERVFDLEYGKFAAPPSAAFRKFISRIPETVGTEASGEAFTELIDKVFL